MNTYLLYYNLRGKQLLSSTSEAVWSWAAISFLPFFLLTKALLNTDGTWDFNVEPRASAERLLWTLEAPQIFIHLTITPLPFSFSYSLASMSFAPGQSQDKEIISMRGVQLQRLSFPANPSGYSIRAASPPCAIDSKNITICKNQFIK